MVKMLNKIIPHSLAFFFKQLNFRKRRFVFYALMGLLGIFAEAFGIGMIVPILDFIRAEGDLDSLIAGSELWWLVNELVQSVHLNLNLFFLVTVFVLFILLRQIFDYFYALLMVSLKNELLHDIRSRLFLGLQSISFVRAQRRTSGEHINLLDYQTEQVSNILPTYLRLFKTASTFLIYAATLTYTAPAFVLLAGCQFALIMMPMGRYIKKSKWSSAEIIRQRAIVTDYFSENYLAARVIRLFNLQRRQSEEFNKISKNYLEELCRLSEIQLKPPLIFGIAIAFVIAIQVFVGYEYLNVNVTTLTFFILIILRLAPTSLSFMGYANNLAVQLPNLTLVNEEMSKLRPSIKSVGKKAAIISDIKSISLENISFNYPGKEEPVIKSFSETFAAGTFNVICGPSGVGKSTLLDLISHLVLPKSGSVKYNGENIATLNEENLRGLIAYSSQEAFVFRGSLEENITLGSRFQSDLFEKTIEICQIHDLVQTGDVGQRGCVQVSRHSLSGGQKQRVSLARSIYRRPQVLLLDEPTSAVDELLEKKIIDGVKNYTKSESIITLMVSHNPVHHEQADKLVRL